jgi:hypothetical protein
MPVGSSHFIRGLTGLLDDAAAGLRLAGGTVLAVTCRGRSSE